MANDSLKDVFVKLNEVVNNAPQSGLEEAAQFAINLITLRTRKGLDADRKRFKPYSARYVPVRKKRGLRTDPPDLTVTGQMLGSMIPVVTGESEITIEFSGAKEIVKAIGNTNLDRDFFDVRASDELDAIADILGEAIVAEVLK